MKIEQKTVDEFMIEVWQSFKPYFYNFLREHGLYDDFVVHVRNSFEEVEDSVFDYDKEDKTIDDFIVVLFRAMLHKRITDIEKFFIGDIYLLGGMFDGKKQDKIIEEIEKDEDIVKTLHSIIFEKRILFNFKS